MEMEHESNNFGRSPEDAEEFKLTYKLMKKKQDLEMMDMASKIEKGGGSAQYAEAAAKRDPNFYNLGPEEQQKMISEKTAIYDAILHRFEFLKTVGYYKPNQGRN